MKFMVYEEGHEGETVIEAPDLSAAKKQLLENMDTLDDVQIVPLCPKCNEPLHTLAFEEAGSLAVNDDGSYSDAQTSGQYFCPNCGKPIGGYGQSCWGINPELE